MNQHTKIPTADNRVPQVAALDAVSDTMRAIDLRGAAKADPRGFLDHMRAMMDAFGEVWSDDRAFDLSLELASGDEFLSSLSAALRERGL